MTPGPSRRTQLVLVSSARSRRLSRVSVHAELLYHKLLLVTDDAGRFPASPLRIGGACFEHRMERGEITMELVRSWVRELERVELLRVYLADDGDSYLELLRLHRPIKSDRKGVILYPDPVAVQLDPDAFLTPTPTPTPTPPRSAASGAGGSPIGLTLDQVRTRTLGALDQTHISKGVPDWFLPLAHRWVDVRLEAIAIEPAPHGLPLSPSAWAAVIDIAMRAGEDTSREALLQLTAETWLKWSGAIGRLAKEAAKDAQFAQRRKSPIEAVAEGQTARAVAKNLASAREDARRMGIDLESL